MQPLDIVALVTALGLGTILTKLVEWFIKRQTEKKEKDKAFTLIFEAINEVYHSMQVMLRECRANRILILKTTNGGGRPKLSGRLYSSVIYEVFEYPLSSVKDNWQNQQLDPSYMRILYEANNSTDGRLIVKTDKLENGILKDVYVGSNIKEAWIYRVLERETEFIYLSVNFTEEQEETPKMKNLFRVGTTNLKNLFSKHSKI